MTSKYSLTFNAIEDLTIGYEKIADFRKEKLRAFKYAERQGWLEELTVNMRGHLPRGYMTLERCKKQAEKYQSRSEFAKQRPSIYQRARREGWLDEVCAAMPGYRSKWELDDCHKEALKHASRSDFQKACPSAYQTARINGWLNVICHHHQRRKNVQWDFLAVKNEAAKYATKSEWRVASGSSYIVAHRNGWLDDACNHMNYKKRVPKGHWESFENCKNAALEYSTRKSFAIECSAAYKACLKHGWLEQVSEHMPGR